MIFLLPAIILAGIYASLLLFYLRWWRQHPVITLPPDFIPQLKITVVIVAHNEGKTIVQALDSIRHQNYPSHLFEVIVVNDRSEDETITLLQQNAWEDLKILHLHEHPAFIKNNAFKKSGIELAVAHASNEWIVVTDADCVASKDWLATIAFAKQQSDAVFITGPVLINAGITWIEKMQEMENIVLMTITGAVVLSKLHDMANGANMSFSKSVFQKAGGFDGNYQYASGDDMFLIEKMRSSFPEKIFFLKSTTATVFTKAKSTWSSLLSQRIRWAQKNKGLKNKAFNRIWGFVGLYHIAIISFALASIFFHLAILPFLLLLITKWVVDYTFMKPGNDFFGKKLNPYDFVILQIMYMWYVLWLGMQMILGRKGDWR